MPHDYSEHARSADDHRYHHVVFGPGPKVGDRMALCGKVARGAGGGGSGVSEPQAICVECFVVFPISREVAEWIENSEGARIQCPDCYHRATGVDDFND